MSFAVGGLGLAAQLLVGACLASVERPKAALQSSWNNYKQAFVQADGRVIDRAADNISTSEGQAYAMVRAAWIGDRDTFDRARSWTRDNLQGGDGARLPAWKWGANAAGTWGTLDTTPASDADQWMIYALLLAHARWHDDTHLAQARALAAAFYDTETAVVGGRRVVLPWPDDGKPVVVVNPSYLLPFVYRALATADPERHWGELVTSSYELLAASRSPSGLPRDWLRVDRATGELASFEADEAPKNAFGYEAFRVAWTLAAEVHWYDEPRARIELAHLDQLRHRWKEQGRIAARIAPDGRELVDYEYPGMYGALLPGWELARPGAAQRLYDEELAPRRAPHGWGDANDYYGQNWIWLGVALWAGLAVPVEAA